MNTTQPFTIIAYHGSGCSIDHFDYAFTNKGNDQNGSGFYFTTQLQEAIGYTEAALNGKVKLGGQDNPTVHVAQLSFEKLMRHDEVFPITEKDLKKILQHAPNLHQALENWADLEYEGVEFALSLAMPAYTHERSDGPTIRTLFKIANDFFGDDVEAFNRALKKVFGIDGVVEEYEGYAHYVAFFPEQIHILERLTVEEARARLDEEMARVERPRSS